VEPLALDGVAGIACNDAHHAPLPSCDATATYANGILTLTKPTPGEVDIAMRVADPSYTGAAPLLYFTFSNSPGCDVKADAGDSSDATGPSDADPADQ
jgi:hypothetical protein